MAIDEKLDSNFIDFVKLAPRHNLKDFDATEINGSDPAGLQEFIQEEALTHQAENLGVTYLVTYKNTIVGFLTLAMGNIPARKIDLEEAKDKRTKRPYPALLLGRLAVHKPWRSKGIGTFMMDWVSGLARDLSRFIGCRYIYLHCAMDKTGYYERRGFMLCEEDEDRPPKWMYKKIV